MDRTVRSIGGITAREADLVAVYTPEIVELSKRGVDSVLVLHMLRDLDPSDPSSHDVNALEVKARTTMDLVSTCISVIHLPLLHNLIVY